MDDQRETAILVSDMQNDVGMLVPTTGTVVAPVKRVIEAARKNGMRVVYIMRVHRADGVDVEKFRAEKFRRSPYLVKGTKGAEMIEALRSQEGDYCVEKHRFDAFHETELDDLLRRLGVRTVVVVGVQTPACVRETATGAIQRDYDTIVLSDATTTASPEAHRSNLADMANLGARIMTVDEFLKLIE